MIHQHRTSFSGFEVRPAAKVIGGRKGPSSMPRESRPQVELVHRLFLLAAIDGDTVTQRTPACEGGVVDSSAA
ncbi:hypothetical protein [Streptomyces europaeiscabiei]|uniref:hypothetical protein n=1 Tax=Streptomyces europaeiscabiei TaxID=146819 RepID=UPI0038F6B2D9